MPLIDKATAIEALKTEFLYFSYNDSDSTDEAVEHAVGEVRKSVVEIIEELPEAGQSITWHPVKEALPKAPGPYLGCGKMGGVYIVKFENGMFWHVGHGSCTKRVIAWAEMPEPYMEEDHDLR